MTQIPLPADPFAAFQTWMTEATARELNDPNAMTLATCTPDGSPSARIVLLKGVDARGFVFYTNLESRKGAELAANPRAALLFHWKTLERQIRIEGRIEPVTPAEADAYYTSRPRLSRIGAWASKQSQPLPSRQEFEDRIASFDAKYPGESVPRPAHWSGFRVIPERFEFWAAADYRLHDRHIYTRAGDGWTTQALYP